MEARINKIEQEIAAKNELLLSARRKLKADPNNTDAQADTEHYENEVTRLETRYNTLITALVNASTQGTESLILDKTMSTQDDMEVDLSPTSSDRSKGVKEIDCIDISSEHLKRPDLLSKLSGLVAQYRFVRLTSPAGSGKSSLLMLFQHSLKNTIVVWISCFSKMSSHELLKEHGIDLNSHQYHKKFRNRDVVVFLDDAQEIFDDIKFWGQLIKGVPTWLPNNFRFIISSTHLLSGGLYSPVELSAVNKLQRSDFLLTAEEANELLELPITGLPQAMKSETIKDVLITECGGLIGALRQSIESLRNQFAKVNQPSEADLLSYFLSNDLLVSMTRCFGSAHSHPIANDFKMFLKKILVNEKLIVQDFTNKDDNESFSSLKKAGVLVEVSDSSFGFSSPLAKRYYFKWMFPNRSPAAPATLSELIKKVVANMSANTLKNSTMPGDFPKEAVFQHLFMEGLALHTPPDCSICPELSKIFPSNTDSNTQQRIPGEIDFYLNSSLRWGIELLVNGDGIGEHISRFTSPNGKYVPLAVNDYAVVDFRRNTTGQPTEISRNPHRITVFWKNDDYSIAQCIFGLDEDPVVISLAN